MFGLCVCWFVYFECFCCWFDLLFLYLASKLLGLYCGFLLWFCLIVLVWVLLLCLLCLTLICLCLSLGCFDFDFWVICFALFGVLFTVGYRCLLFVSFNFVFVVTVLTCLFWWLWCLIFVVLVFRFWVCVDFSLTLCCAAWFCVLNVILVCLNCLNCLLFVCVLFWVYCIDCLGWPGFVGYFLICRWIGCFLWVAV